MAGEAVGFSLVIDEALIKRMEKAQEMIDGIAKKSEEAEQRVVASFKKMGDLGVDYFINKLNEAQNKLNSLSVGNIKLDSSVFDNVSSKAATGADNVNELTDAIMKMRNAMSSSSNKTQPSDFNIAELKAAIRSLSDILDNTFLKLGKANQQVLVNARDAFKQELKIQEESERIKQERAEKTTEKAINLKIKETQEFEKMTTAEQEAYLKSLDKMIQERMKYQERMKSIAQAKDRLSSDVNKSVESEIRKENEAYQKELEKRIKIEQEYQKRIAELQEARQQRSQEIKSINETAKARTEAYKRSYNEQYREYVKMFDAIEAKEKEKQLRTYSGAMTYSSLADTFSQEKQAIEYLIAARNNLSRADENYAKRLNLINEEIRRHEENLKRSGKTDNEIAEEAQKNSEKRRQAALKEAEAYERRKKAVMDKWYSSSADRALNFSASTKSINEQVQAIKYLQIARANLSKGTMSDEEYRRKVQQLTQEIQRQQKEVNSLIGKNEQLQKSHNRLMDTAGQLARKLALVFSVSQISGYIQTLAKVRGEFELQQKSLQVLLQSKDEADKLWQQTLELAVKSPFRVGELVAYTRQLAAYRIETDKLHETTRKLADVSAGLGVDMNRLILAYGQVRAAEYLRGTELRQFTEAGIPMLDELANRFTALEGRMVSAGDVFERISKRMVSFKDVAEVFDSMTSASGIFYRMQEQQSSTLAGMISNLHDSIDIMLNDIGKSNDGILKGAVNTAKGVVENWREIAFILEKIVYLMAPTKIAMMAYTLGAKNAGKVTLWWNDALKAKIGTTMADVRTLTMQEAKVYGLSRAQYAAGKATLYLQGALRGVGLALKAMAIPAIIGLVLELYRRMTEASRAAEELEKNLSNLLNEDTSKIKEQSDNFKSLVTQLRNANEASQERRDIINKLNSQYGQYLNFIVNENTSINDLANSYDEVIKRMKEKAALATMEKGLNVIAESYGRKLTDAENQFRDLFKGASIKKVKDDFGFIIPTEDDIDNIMSILQLKIRELNADQMDSLDKQQKIIQSIVKEYYGEEFFLSRDYAKSIELIDILVQKKEEEEKLEKRINTQYKETLKSREANIAFDKLQNEYKKKQIEINKEANLTDFEVRQKLEKAKEKYELDKIELKLTFGEISENEARLAKERILNWATNTVKDVNEKLKLDKELFGFTEEQMSAILISQEEQGKGMAAIIKNTIDGWKNANEIIAEQISLKSAGLRIDEKTLEKYQAQEKMYRRRAEALGIELKYVTKINEATLKSINERLPDSYKLSLEDSYKSINDLMGEYTTKENEAITLLQRIYIQSKEKLDIDHEQVNTLKEQITHYREIRKLLGEAIEPAISESSKNAINALLPAEYQISFIDGLKSVTELQNDANQKRKAAIELEKTYQQQVAQGIPVEDELMKKVKDDIEFFTKKWNLLGGIEEEKKAGAGRTNSLYDERIKVIDDMNKKFKELNKTLGETEAMQGAFDAYIDAFAKAFEEISWIPKDVKQMTPQEFASSVLNFPNEDALVTFLDRLAKEPMKTFEKIKVELAKGKYVYDMKVNAKVFDDKELIRQIEDLFSGYELSIELDKMNIPTNMAKDLFDIDATSLDELKAKLQDLKPLFIGTDMEEQYKKYLNKISDMEDKAGMERLKKYTNYLIAAQSEAVKIKLEEARKIAEIESISEMNPAQKEIAKGAVREETQKKLDKQQWDDFKNTDMYIELFEDLDNVSTKTLNRMKEKLVEMRDSLKNLDPSQLKEITKRIEDVNKALVSKNPFKGILSSIKNVITGYKEYKEAEDVAFSAQKEVDEQQRVVDNLQLQVEAQKKVVYEKNKSSKSSSAEKAVEATYLSLLEAQLAKEKNILNTKKQQADESNTEKNSKKDVLRLSKEQLSEAANVLNQQLSSLNDIKDAWSGVFGGMSDGLSDAFDTMQEIGGGISNVMSGLAQGPSGYLQAAAGALQVIGGLFSIGDKKKERQIQREIKKVEDLQHAYEKLEKAIDDAYAIDTLERSTKNAKANLQAQIASYNKMIAAEEDKKKTDNERIKEWRYAIEELREQIKELDEQAFNEATGNILDNVLNAATEFTDAWLEAFKETGNGLTGLEDNFKEAVTNMLKQQASMLITSTYVDKWKKNLEKYINTDDLELTTTEAKKWVEDVKSTLPQLSNALKEYFDAMKGAGIDLAGGYEMSGLQRGIQGITESQADILAAYMNSVRFYVAEQNTYLQQIANSLVATDVENPMVTQLKIIASQTSAINTLLNSLTTPYRNGGRGLKVVM